MEIKVEGPRALLMVVRERPGAVCSRERRDAFGVDGEVEAQAALDDLAALVGQPVGLVG